MTALSSHLHKYFYVIVFLLPSSHFFFKFVKLKEKQMDIDSIEKRVGEFIRKNLQLNMDIPVVVGLSGGADSVALLHILNKLGYTCIACHCNFQLRGDESVRDRNFALERSIAENVVFDEIAFDTERYVKEHKISVEMACRELRYDWFEKIREKYKAQAIAVAHHRDDSIETLFLNLIRGTGIAGITGINARNGNIVRPLLGLSRNEIEAYLTKYGIDYVTDSTNKEDTYLRNRIRLHLIPFLQEINPAVKDVLSRTMENLEEVSKVYRSAIDEQKDEVVTVDKGLCFIDTEKLMSQPSPRTLLFEILKNYGFNPSQVDSILENVCGTSGRIFLSDAYRLVTDRNRLIIAPHGQEKRRNDGQSITRDMAEWNGPVKLYMKYITNKDFIIKKNKNYAYFDADLLSYPLTVRKWETGDSFMPFGMNGRRKKISDFFTDRKFSLLEKESALLLCSGENILWLIGERSSDVFRITDKTKLILEVECKK
ncbi:MAG: tRNA lysidine(34) synthetase TilS [Barnesiella sp.]